MPDHIEASVLKNFMLGLHKLQEHEETHLIHCKDCMASMTKATLEHLQSEKGDQEG
jgi:hypothetical protein